MDILTLLWTAFSFVLSILWSLAWFVLRDLISTLLWILIVAWLLLSVRYRSFVGGSVAMLRYGSLWAEHLLALAAWNAILRSRAPVPEGDHERGRQIRSFKKAPPALRDNVDFRAAEHDFGWRSLPPLLQLKSPAVRSATLP